VLEGRATNREIVVVGAHYDSAPGSPGANDNATGVATVLELARLLQDRPRQRELRLVAFVNEEPPYFQTENMGSLVYARELVSQGAPVVAMLTPETLGYYSEARGSQHYPFPFGLLYPDTGNFVGFVGNLGSLSLVRRCVGSFRHHAAFPSEGAAVPASIEGVAWSDHWAFWEQGVPALMVTDTAPHRDPHYHTAGDRPDHVDTERLARVVQGLAGVVDDLLNDRRR
ncbi:MAG: M28 family peptidase, partial [Pseudomonadota bacterium]